MSLGLALTFLVCCSTCGRLVPAVAVTPEDREALLVVRGILSIISQAMAAASAARQQQQQQEPGATLATEYGSSRSSRSSGDFGSSSSSGAAGSSSSSGAPGSSMRAMVTANARAATSLSPLLPELLPGIVHTGDLFVRALLKRASTRLSAVSLAALLAAPSLSSAAASSLPTYAPSITGARPPYTGSSSYTGLGSPYSPPQSTSGVPSPSLGFTAVGLSNSPVPPSAWGLAAAPTSAQRATSAATSTQQISTQPAAGPQAGRQQQPVMRQLKLRPDSSAARSAGQPSSKAQ